MPAWLEINEPPWIPLYSYYQGQMVKDALLHTQYCITPGISGASTPVWNDAGGTTNDGTVVWQDTGLGGVAGSGITDRTEYLWMGGGEHSWSLQLRQRGTASIDLDIANTYSPIIGTQVFLYDVTSSGSTRIFAGTIDEIETRWPDRNLRRILTLRCVTFEQVFDTTLVPARLYENKTAGYIFNDLLSLVAGSPIVAGTISAGATIVSLLCDGSQTIGEIYSQLAQASGFIWGVEIATLEAYFQTPSTTPAPFSLAYPTVLMDSLTLNESRQEFRDWEGVKLGAEAFAHSAEFFVGTGQKNFTLLRPCSSVTNVWVVYPPGLQNHATGLLSAQPSNGDTITFSFPNSGSIYNWAATAPYTVGQIVIDDAGHVQRCTFAGTSGGSTPAWNDAGGVTIDNTVIWQDDGAAGFATDSLITYTFVDTLDNRLFGQVLIGPDEFFSAFNLMSAINADALYRGIGYSLPTWENPLVNAENTYPSGTVVVRNKPAGQGFIAALSASCANWSWDAAQTYGGGTGHTLVIPIGVEGTTTQGFVYTPGSASCSLATPLNVGSSLQVEYIRADVGLIAVQDDALIAQRALIEDGTGLYQQIADGTRSLVQTNNVTGLLFAQQSLEAFSNHPLTMKFDTYVPGLLPGQYLAVVMNYPLGSNVVLDGNWVVQEVTAELVPATPYMTGYGHYRYTVRLINIGQTVSYLDFWEGLGGGSGGSGGQGSAFGGGSQPSALQAPVTIEGATVAPTLTLIQNTPSDVWAALTAYNVNDTIIDWNNHIQLCTIGGTSGATQPYPWDDSGGTTIDATVTWLDQGEGGLALLAGNIRCIYNVIMNAAAFPDNTSSGVAGHFGIDARINGLSAQLFVRNTTGTPLLTFDSNNTRILADVQFNITDNSAGTVLAALTVTQNGSTRLGIDCSGAVNFQTPPAGGAFVSLANQARIYADAGGILQVSENGGAYVPLVSSGGSIGGANTQIQYNNAGVFGGDANLTWTTGSALLYVGGTARMLAANFPDNTGSGVAGNFGIDAAMTAVPTANLFIRDTSGNPMMTFNGVLARITSDVDFWVGAAGFPQNIIVTGTTGLSGQLTLGSDVDFNGSVLNWYGVAAPAVSVANTSRLYVDVGGILKISQNGAAYVNVVGSGGTPGGANTEVQFNNSGVFGGSSDLTWNGTVLTVTQSVVTAGLVVSGGGIGVTTSDIDIIAGVLKLNGVTRIDHAGAGFLTALTISTSGLTVTLGGISVTGGITINTGGIGVTLGNVDITAGTLNLAGVARITNAGGGALTSLTCSGSMQAKGSNTQLQFNSAGVLAGDGNLTWNGATLSALGVSTSGLTVTSSGIFVDGGITINTGSLTVSAGTLAASGNLRLAGVTRVNSAGGAILTAMTMNGNAGFTGTLAAAIASGANVDNGIIY